MPTAEPIGQVDETEPVQLEDPGPIPAEPEQDWFFTFGHGHRGYSHSTLTRAADPQAVGFRLDDRYVRIRGTYDSARERMFLIFGQVWSMHYSTEQFAVMAERFELTELVLTADWPGPGAIGAWS